MPAFSTKQSNNRAAPSNVYRALLRAILDSEEVRFSVPKRPHRPLIFGLIIMNTTTPILITDLTVSKISLIVRNFFAFSWKQKVIPADDAWREMIMISRSQWTGKPKTYVWVILECASQEDNLRGRIRKKNKTFAFGNLKH